MTTTQVQGFTLANLLEVEANTKAARVTLRAEDFGALGIYSVGGVSGLMAAGLAGASRIFSFRWGDTTRLALVKRVTFSAGNDSTAFTAGTCLFNMFRAQSFTVSDTVGTSLVPTVNQNKLRTTGMGSSLLTSARIATTLAVSGGTITTTDAQPVGALCCSVPNVAGSAMLSPWPLFEAMPGEYPLVLAQDEGFLIQATVPATGTWKFSVRVDWTEIAAY